MSQSPSNIGIWRRLIPMGLSYMASGGSLIASSAAQLITFAILARALGVHQFGLFVAVTAITNIAVQLCGLGGIESLVRRVARDRAIYPAMLGHSILLTLGSGIVLIAVGLSFLPARFPLTTDAMENLLATAMLLASNILLYRFILLTEHIFIAHSDFASANTVVFGFAVARTVAAALGCLVFGVSSVFQWAEWQFAVHLLSVALCFLAIRRLGRPQFRIVSDEVRLGLLVSAAPILRAVRSNADLMVLSVVASPEIVGSYGLARRILDSSYMSVDALNRLIYPGSAVAAEGGLHNTASRVTKVLLVATAIGVLTAIAVFLLAPLLPILFGADYVSLVPFARILCWDVILVAIWSVALDALGASGNHATRTTILGAGSLLGAALVAFATWVAPPTGAFISFYVIDAGIAIAAWMVLVRMMRRSRRDSEVPLPDPLRT
jgi:O-antigen/teichoic acid export membrane protein